VQPNIRERNPVVKRDPTVCVCVCVCNEYWNTLLSRRAMLDLPANPCTCVPEGRVHNQSQALQLRDNGTPAIIREVTRSVNREPECGLTAPTINRACSVCVVDPWRMGTGTLEGLWVPYLRFCYQTHTHNRHGFKPHSLCIWHSRGSVTPF